MWPNVLYKGILYTSASLLQLTILYDWVFPSAEDISSPNMWTPLHWHRYAVCTGIYTWPSTKTCEQVLEVLKYNLGKEDGPFKCVYIKYFFFFGSWELTISLSHAVKIPIYQQQKLFSNLLKLGVPLILDLTKVFAYWAQVLYLNTSSERSGLCTYMHPWKRKML